MHEPDATTGGRASTALRCSTPLFRPFFLGGLGLFLVGMAFLIAGPALGPAEGPASASGFAAFLSTFGLFLMAVPLVGRLPFRREVIVDPASGVLVRRDRTLVRRREESIPIGEIRSVEVEEGRFVDGDPDLTLVLRLDSGRSVAIDRFTERGAAEAAAGRLRDRIAGAGGAEAGAR